MIEQLFGSKTRVKLLQLFYSNPNRQFYVREITRKIDEQINSVRRELSNLLSIGIITSDNTNNKLYYEVNQKYEYYKPLQQIFGKAKKVSSTGGSGNQIDPELKSIGHIGLLVYTGQFTRDSSSGVDILIVGDVNANALAKYIEDLEKNENKSLRYAVMSVDDFRYRRLIRDRFTQDLDRAKKQIVVDEYYLLLPEPKEEEKK
ncbi:MAG TPA: hypothetical protein VL989_02535 [Candidatus Sulfotelmatobacter sp.]|nr:hypothetical protein [Candidatus Sulfotelmatobacter sp.]